MIKRVLNMVNGVCFAGSCVLLMVVGVRFHVFLSRCYRVFRMWWSWSFACCFHIVSVRYYVFILGVIVVE